jgi:hypothetical protein
MSVIFLSHFDGTNGSQTFVDEYGHTMAPTSAAPVLSTTSPKFGTASLYFSTATDYINITSGTTDFNFGTGDFTIECWVNPDSAVSAKAIFALANTSSSTANWLMLYISSAGYPVWLANGATFTSSIATPAGSWAAVCLCRNAGTTTLYVNGVLGRQIVSDTNNYTSAGAGTPVVAIGTYYNGSFIVDFKGYIDELRISNTAQYSAEYTPAAGPFANPGGGGGGGVVALPSYIVLDPRGVTFARWSAFMAEELSGIMYTQSCTDDKHWQEWATKLVDNPLLGGTVADPRKFSDWRQWVTSWLTTSN